MKIKFKNLRFREIALLIFAAHTVLLLVNLLPIYFFNVQAHQPGGWLNLTIRIAWGIYLWMLISPFILWLGYIFPFVRSRLWHNIFIHLTVSILTGVVRLFVYNLGILMIGFYSLEAFQAELSKPTSYIQSITGAIVHYFLIIAVQQAYLYFRESQERALHLQQAELQMLKMQLHPHFFFNTLNAISALIHDSPKDADRMIIQLGNLFRVALKKDKAQEITLKEELEFLESYLQIHQTLMGKRLTVKWSIQPEALDALVPNLILQPLAENAIQHGIAPQEMGGLIQICAVRQSEKLLLQVCDDGQGFVSQSNNAYGGIGLVNTRARLENLYNGEHKLSIGESMSGGFSVKIEIPFREQSVEEK